MIRKLLVSAMAAPLLAVVCLVPVATAAAQATKEAPPEEVAAYTAWYGATQANDTAKATEAAKQYLTQFPNGQFAPAIKQWLGGGQMAALDAAIKEKRTADMINIGREVLKSDPENLLVLYQMAFTIWSSELVAAPAKLEHLADAVEFTSKAMPMIEAGKTPAGATSFDKNVALAWMSQLLAINAANSGKTDEALKLYARSNELAPANTALVTRNLFAVLGLRQSAYGDAVKAFKAFPEPDQQAPDAKPEVKAALDRVNTEADALVDAAAGFVAYTKIKGVAATVRDKVNQTLEAVYKSRHPEDASLSGLQKIVQDKEATFSGTAAAAAPAPAGD